jgi:hypothetical protein
MSRPVQPQRIWIVLITVLLLAAMFHLATIRDGHLWGDDFARYIQHAKNLLEGRDYAAGFIHNPLEPGISPTAYPPVTSLILLPVYWFAGLFARVLVRWTLPACYESRPGRVLYSRTCDVLSHRARFSASRLVRDRRRIGRLSSGVLGSER